MDCYRVALALQQDGYETIPMKNKQPLVKFANEPITPGFIERNSWKYKSVTALGLLCRGVWCIDIDISPQKNGYESIKAIAEYKEFLENAKETLAQKTPSGGMHYIFKKREGIEYGHKVNYLSGVDIKAHPNNYVILGESVTNKGKYEMNDKDPIYYQGKLEKRIFSAGSTYEKQGMNQSSRVLALYGLDHLISKPKGQGLGREAYERIVNGTSINRNDDLFKAFSYCKACNVSIEPLRVVIGDRKGNDVFTEKEFNATLKSAFR